MIQESVLIEKDQRTGCWLLVGVQRRDHAQARREAYQSYLAPLPEGAAVGHHCERTDCINPQHLRLITNNSSG